MAERLVIDASVAVKWFVKDHLEADLDVADEILSRCLSGEIELHAPWNFLDEVCGQLVSATQSRYAGSRTPRLPRDEAFSCVDDLFHLPIVSAERKLEDAVSAITLALDGSKTFYDMTYLGLAERMGCSWCTADEKVSLAAPPSFPTDRIVLLSSLRLS